MRFFDVPTGVLQTFAKKWHSRIRGVIIFFFATPLVRECRNGPKVRKTPAGAPSKKYAPGRRENHTFWKSDSHQWFEHDFGGHEKWSKVTPKSEVAKTHPAYKNNGLSVHFGKEKGPF